MNNYRGFHTHPSWMLLVLAGTLPLGCWQEPVTDHLAEGIINGDPIGSNEFPATGQLIFQGIYQQGQQQMPLTVPICTATLVATDVVLSAGHCVDEYLITYGMGQVQDPVYCITFEEDQSWMFDQQYQYNAPLPADAVCSTGFVQHPQFDMDALYNAGNGLGNLHDLSLIFLEQPITNRPFAYMPTAAEGGQLQAGMDVDIVGYGMRSVPQGQYSDPNDANQRYWARTFINELGNSEMQIGSDSSTGRKCHGDSGGPTFVDIQTTLTESQRVIGVTSRAYNLQADCNLGGVDARVDDAVDWIDTAMRDACDAGLRTDCSEPGMPRPPEEEAADDDDDDDTAGDDDDTSSAGDDDDDAADDDAADDDDGESNPRPPASEGPSFGAACACGVATGGWPPPMAALLGLLGLGLASARRLGRR